MRNSSYKHSPCNSNVLLPCLIDISHNTWLLWQFSRCRGLVARWHGATVSNNNVFHRLVIGARLHLFNLRNHILSFHDTTKDNVLAVQMRRRFGGDEKLRSVRPGPRIGHGQKKGLLVLQFEILVLKLFTVDTLTTATIARGKVTTLYHELLNDTVEGAALVVEWLAFGTHALFTRTQGQEILRRVGRNIHVQLHHDAADRVATVLNIDWRSRVGERI